MALAAPQLLTKAGVTPAYNTPLASEVVTITAPNCILHVKNANASPCTVTITDPGFTPGGSSPISPTIVVPATTGDKLIFIPQQFVLGGIVGVLFSIQTSVTAAVFTTQ
jgi:hypothetical protein